MIQLTIILKIAIATLLVFSLMKIVVPVLTRFAIHIDLMDKPSSARKIHGKAIPLIGGISIAISIGLTTFLFPSLLDNIPSQYFILLLGSMIILLTGVVDDKIDISPKVKLLIQGICSFALVSQGVYFDVILDQLISPEIPRIIKQAISIVFIVGIVNAYNLMDGIDGLVGSLFILAFGFIFFVAVLNGIGYLAFICAIIVAALFGFLTFNLKEDGKIFMGDGGSLFLGFLLAAISIEVSNNSTNNMEVTNIGLLVILSLPVFDAIRVFYGRIKRNKSPFAADRSHIHHILLKAIPSQQKVGKLISFFVVITTTVSCITTLLYGATAAIIMHCLFSYLLLYLINLQAKMFFHKVFISELESMSR